LRSQLKVLLGMSMSGVPYVHSDAGGFAGGDGDNELYIRWLQFAAFTPIFRPHGTALYDVEPAAKSFPSEAALIDTPYRMLAQYSIISRYALVPYSYSLAFQQAAYGKPLIAPLYFYYPKDTIAAKTDDQFFYGENILVAPVIEKGQQVRKFYLPEGRWYSPLTQSVLSGGHWYADSVTLVSYPILFKEGSFIPTEERTSNAQSNNPEETIISYFPSDRSSSFELYEDDGVTKNNMITGKFHLTLFKAFKLSETRQSVIIRSNGGKYPGMPATKKFILRIALEKMPKQVSLNGKVLNRSERSSQDGYRIINSTLQIDINFNYKPQTVIIEW
jgi:oligosaccharide 4-alpha-D-glucosyltransferase